MSRSLFDDLPPPTPQRRVFTVSELNRRIRATMQERFPSLWVSGEINDLARPSSGHVYLTLKDQDGQIKAVIWRNTAAKLPFDLEDGMEVVCEGSID
ncbi:MAG: exodeoxyribonuclease VII large subunit, partial [Planctomycetales bacterium]|nr:exodeoxyribonuclease VII large subunit [Planctomycetales bacterium]